MLKNRKVALTTVIDIATIKHSAKIARQNTAILNSLTNKGSSFLSAITSFLSIQTSQTT